MDLLSVRKTFGNGSVDEYFRKLRERSKISNRKLSEEEAEKERIRNNGVKRRTRALERALTMDLSKFFTLTVPEGSPLRNDPKAFIKLVNNFLSTQGVNFFAHLQKYRSNGEYHVHGLSDGEIDLSKWIEMTGANPKDLYCQDVYRNSNQKCAAKYILRDCANLPKGLRATASNIKTIKAESHFQVIDTETGEILSDTFYGQSVQNESADHHKSHLSSKDNERDSVSSGTMLSDTFYGQDSPNKSSSKFKNRFSKKYSCLKKNIAHETSVYNRSDFSIIVPKLHYFTYIYYSMGGVCPFKANAPPLSISYLSPAVKNKMRTQCYNRMLM